MTTSFMRSPTCKRDAVMDYLSSGAGLTSDEAREQFGVTNFAQMIKSIKKQVEAYGNWRIVAYRSKRTGITRYSLKRVRLVGPTNG